MRMIHTSDWHLGRSFHQVGLQRAHARFLDDLVDVVRSEEVDAVVVSGDVYDRALPAPDTVALLSDTVERLIDAGAAVVLSSGNHDSAIRLGFASRLLERSGLHIRTSVDDIGRPVVVDGVAIHPLPYLEPSLTAGPLGASDRTHAAVLRAAMDRVRASLASGSESRSVVMAHAFVTGGATSESERDIAVGGVAAVPPEVFDGVDYAALGHLHGRQQVAETVRYSGSPVAMSFSEARHTKGSWLVDLAGDAPSTEFVPAPVERPLALLRGTLDELLSERQHAAAESAWCQVTLTDPIRPLGAMERLRVRFPHTLDLRFEPSGTVTTMTAYAASLTERSDLDVCCDFLGHVRGGHGADEAERALLRDAVEGARVRRANREGEGRASGSSRSGAA
ncbi:exonuclease SbcCD subunit D [Knoellia subterranea]|uniref:Nuclease SbcCD subunit D n=1 Tax=Knoellia subterranea KCTC 19937 TaxID=1385521 RepID=A0A0A0JSN9_9MICO|nr:exonuclease SbcCD subunit D [Knoellia subterranea]KGN38641.1 exonuclease SbcD [Knoellia subterranea KCTC 19937]